MDLCFILTTCRDIGHINFSGQMQFWYYAELSYKLGLNTEDEEYGRYRRAIVSEPSGVMTKYELPVTTDFLR